MIDITVYSDDYAVIHEKTDNVAIKFDDDKCVYEVKVRRVPLVLCKDCRHRPVLDDPNDDSYGFNVRAPENGSERCPCLVEDGWYSWRPDDDFFCGFGERRADD